MSLVSRRVHLLGENFIKRHRWMKQRYLRVENQTTELFQPYTDGSLVSIIREVSENPLAASYVEEIVINDSMGLWGKREPSWEEKTARAKESEHPLDFLESLFANCPYIHRTAMANWLMEIDLGDENGLVALLLTLVPNIHTIYFRPYNNEPTITLDTVEAIRRDSNRSALNRLTKIIIDAQYAQYTQWGPKGMKPLLAFSQLPSMQAIHTDKLSDGERPWAFPREDLKPGVSTVREITVTRADLSSSSLNDIVSAFKGLEKFVYEPCDPQSSDYEYNEFKPNDIRDILLRSARHSLTHLGLHARCRKREYMGSLRDFISLTDVDTDWGLVRDSTVPSKNQLTNVLPSSVERLCLTPDPGHLIDVSIYAIYQLIAEKSRNFPSLESIHLAYTGGDPDLITKARDHRVNITFDSGVDPDTKRKAYLDSK